MDRSPRAKLDNGNDKIPGVCQTVIIIWLKITKTMLIPDMISARLTKILLSLAFIAISTVPVLAQQTETTTPETIPTEEPESDNSRSQPNNFLSLQGGKQLMSEASEAINNQQYEVAADKLQKARQVFNQLSNFYLQLFNNFSGIDNRVAQSQRGKALETGQMRDEATYQLALVHRAQEQTELSVPLLVQVVNSQNPTSELGKKAYQQLYEIGFVDEPFTGSNAEN
ncbi:conserved hypothetical protein [Hyella patelloides LEGE 07179]|uniref:Uncharacterized protein n=2 Tax=Hyella TaxID=945733 RepID=A0A563W2F3_9CYAN|nr:hypothetical protein [Hyella patelloides]VEP17846.1 conserved hypothetical protein [Hyella patelloides LEGE 07179]